ncbi:hypothetical protein RhiirB3_424314 [Rhizophagus irregularis]|nr:hypothetical protein RhiirB3_424314 [Rhizophagus irregularis]
MSQQLPADCLNDIFDYLEENKTNLHSCLLVNRQCCDIAVRILWRNVWNFQSNNKPRVSLSIISTLIACLPRESKDHLHKNGISIFTPTQKPPLYNYASFCKVISINEIDEMVQYILKGQPTTLSRSLNFNKYLLSQEILKMFMNQILSLKSLEYYLGCSQNIIFTCLPGAKTCLLDLIELKCRSDIYSEFFYQISQICYNIQLLTIELRDISNGLADLIFLQNNLKSVTLISISCDEENEGTKALISSLTKFSLSLIKLKIIEYYIPLSFIAIFKNLEELILSFELNPFDDFIQLQQFNFSNLKVLKFLYAIPRVEMLIKFLEINGKTLTEFYVGDHDSKLNVSIAKFCPNLKILFTIFIEKELDILELIFNSCQYLESIRVWCGDGYLNDKEFLDILVKSSPKNFYELEIYYCSYHEPSEILPKELEGFFINWKNRMTQKSLSLTIFNNTEGISLEANEENMKIIKKYEKVGLIKKFRIKEYDYDED